MISENGVPKNPGFFTLRSGSQKWVLNFVSFRLEIFLTDSLRSRICFFLGGSFLVPVRSYLTVTDLQSARVALLEAHSSSTFPSLRFWSSYHPLRYCESLFASRYASFFFSCALRVCSASKSRFFSTHKGTEQSRRPLDSLSQLADNSTTAAP